MSRCEVWVLIYAQISMVVTYLTICDDPMDLLRRVSASQKSVSRFCSINKYQFLWSTNEEGWPGPAILVNRFL